MGITRRKERKIMYIQPINDYTFRSLVFQLINVLHKHNIIDIYTIHSWQIDYKSKPAKILNQIIQALEEIKKHHI